MEDIVLKLENISYSYDDQPPAIQGISVEIGANEKIAVIGNNGAGKSTFFLCCNGVLMPDQGNLFLRDQQIKHNRKDLAQLRQTVGIVFQDPAQQFVGSSVEGDISFGPINLGLNQEAVRDRVEEAIKLMSLENLRDRPPHYLSGGEKKRLSIADVVAMHPQIILFDEPTASLDNYNIKMFGALLDQFSKAGKTSIISTHDVDFAWRWSDRVLLFSQGRLIADDTPEKIFTDSALLGAARIAAPTMLCFSETLAKNNVIPEGHFPKTLEELSALLSL